MQLFTDSKLSPDDLDPLPVDALRHLRGPELGRGVVADVDRRGRGVHGDAGGAVDGAAKLCLGARAVVAAVEAEQVGVAVGGGWGRELRGRQYSA